MAEQGNATSRWTSPWTGIFLVLFALIALYCSYGLLSAELTVLNNPDAVLACDINPILGCSDSLLAPQAHLFGIPNSAVAMFAFGALIGVSSVLIFGGSLPRFVWWGLAAGMTVGLVYVGYFLFLSVAVFRALCPYCIGIWVAILGAAPLAWFSALSSGAFGKKFQSNGKSLLRYWWAVSFLLYLVVVLIIVTTMSDKIGVLFT